MALSDQELRSGRNLVRWIVAGTILSIVLGVILFSRGDSPARTQCKAKYAAALTRADTLRVDNWIAQTPASGKRTCGDLLGYH